MNPQQNYKLHCSSFAVLAECRSFLTEDKLGISKLAHFRNIQACHLGFRGNPVADKVLKHHVQNEAEGENETQQSGDSYELGSKLTGISVEEAGHRTGDTVPASSVVAGDQLSVAMYKDRCFAI